MWRDGKWLTNYREERFIRLKSRWGRKKWVERWNKTERGKMKKSRGLEKGAAWALDPWKRNGSLEDPRFVGHSQNSAEGQRQSYVWAPRFTAQLDSRRTWGTELVYGFLLWERGRGCRSQREPQADRVLGLSLTLFRNFTQRAEAAK